MAKRLVVSFLVLAIVAAFAPMTQAQSFPDSREYRRYWGNQIIRDFSPGGLYTQQGWYYNQHHGYGRDGYSRRDGFARNILPLVTGVAGYFVGQGRGRDQGRREGYEAGINDARRQYNAQEPQEPERPMRNNEGFIQGISFVNETQCVVTLFNRRLNQEQDIRPGGKTGPLPWYHKDVRALAFIEGQLVELDLELQGNRVAITAPSGS
ncbi:MAG: hypothetical protein AAB864_00745 [Patescibacteria group bacterium]